MGQQVLSDKKRIQELLKRLKKEHPDARCLLSFATPLQLLVGTILSAQCTDERVNQVTPALFQKYPDAASLAEEDLVILEAAIRPTGFFKNKAKNIQSCCRILQRDHGGQVPSDMEALLRLPGVGRKTANCILANAWNRPAIIVDTHVKRLSHRLNLSRQEDPDKIEIDLQAQIPRKAWTHFSHTLGFHGRRVCVARKPRCESCVLSRLCPSSATTS